MGFQGSKIKCVGMSVEIGVRKFASVMAKASCMGRQLIESY